MPDRYMSRRVVTVGLSSADSYRYQELEIGAVLWAAAAAGGFPGAVQEDTLWTLPATATKVTAGTPVSNRGALRNLICW